MSEVLSECAVKLLKFEVSKAVCQGVVLERNGCTLSDNRSIPITPKEFANFSPRFIPWVHQEKSAREC